MDLSDERHMGFSVDMLTHTYHLFDLDWAQAKDVAQAQLMRRPTHELVNLPEASVGAAWRSVSLGKMNGWAYGIEYPFAISAAHPPALTITNALFAWVPRTSGNELWFAVTRNNFTRDYFGKPHKKPINISLKYTHESWEERMRRKLGDNQL